jgi:hypothetical protein
MSKVHARVQNFYLFEGMGIFSQDKTSYPGSLASSQEPIGKERVLMYPFHRAIHHI